MIRLADHYLQARNIYISAICDGPSGAKVANFIKEQSERQGRQFVMVAHGTATPNPWVYTTRCSTSFMTQWKIQNLSTLMQHTMQWIVF